MMGLDELSLIILATLGIIVTYYISVHLGKGNVLGSAVVVFMAGLLETVFPGLITTEHAGVLAAASYAGMVSGDKIGSMRQVTALGIICGMMFIATAPAYVGFGGRLGTLAALSCGTFFGYRTILERTVWPKFGIRRST
ncbi:hypothetical protein [Natranaerobius thermophilus]|uniref:Uncharacterized protein n=1 Tax=Natranaerobius thermophilus (strain ATCC BAA-1301 / DSM 18059 / JW/NM-WN-LF) TaxID=457570 RepID=B2A3R2_NATTJ|nr:hypothetical protein [Natranaerobius thermophilus]ACB83688.1 conserved hypothetical protein [Natranaerobius thermophilus JW/NM-WN-LF]